MSYLKKIQAADGPEGGTDHGASNPENWVTRLQTGKNERERYNDAKTLNGILMGWQEQALVANQIFEEMMANGGILFEKHSPDILKGCKRENLEIIIKICERVAKAAPIV
jgi:hypothetical protein